MRGAAKMECHLGNMFDRLEVHAAINNIVSEVEEKFEIRSAVQKTVDRIVVITFNHWQTNHCTKVAHC